METTDHYWRFKINVAPHSTAQFTVNEELPEVNAYQLSNLTPDQITRFISRRYLSPEMKQALENILDLKAQIAALGRQWQEKQQMITSVTKDQERMRENLRALGKSEEERKLVARYVARLSEGEDRIEQLRREEAQLGEQRRTLQHRLDDALRRLVLEHRVGT